MPIIVPDGLPIIDTLRNRDKIDVIGEADASRQDIRPLEIAVVNLMPKEVQQRTERELARQMGHTILQVRPILFHVRGGEQSADSKDPHLTAFYKPFEAMHDQPYDGMIITGAPLEEMEWTDVQYWDQLRSIIDWSRKNVTMRLFICWGAQAGIKHIHGLNKQLLPEKAFGVFPHTTVAADHPLVAGFDDVYDVPVSRKAEIPLKELEKTDSLQVLSRSTATGAYLVAGRNGRDLFAFNHPEYVGTALDYEYRRDVAKNGTAKLPVNYYPDNDPTKTPIKKWASHARALHSNLLGQIYKKTTPELKDIPSLPDKL